MTTWVSGDLITSTWLNSVEKILALGTFAATTEPRLTMAANINYDIAGVVATNITLNDSFSVTVNKAYEWLSVRSLTTVIPAGTGWAAVLSFNHSSTVGANASAYGVIGTVTGTSGTGKVNPFYGRATATSTFTGIAEAGQLAITYDTGATVNSQSAILGMERSGSNVNAFPFGILAYSNTAGSKLGIMFAVDPSLYISTGVIRYIPRTGSTGYFLKSYDESSSPIFEVDYLGNINFAALNGATDGQLITGDMSHATPSKQLAFQTSYLNNTTALNIIANGTGTASYLKVWNGSDRSVAKAFTLGMSASGATLYAASLDMRLGTRNTASIHILDNGNATPADIFLGATQDSLDVGDLTGYHYIQAVAGAPTDPPTNGNTYPNFKAMRYDSNNNKIYVYNGGWKASAALT